MQTFLRRALFAFLAAWMPFCCCQVRAAARALAHAPHAAVADAPGREANQGTPAEDRCCDPELPPCCLGSGDAGGEGANGPGDCCGTERPAGDPDCCAACKDRVGPVAPPVELPEPAPQLDVISTVLLADAARAGARPRAGDARSLDTGPPWRPHGRTTLAFHATLLI